MRHRMPMPSHLPEETPPPFVSVIIPAFNEAANVGETISRAQCDFIPNEIIVVDGGSTDETIRISEDAGAQVIRSACRQRAAQMNTGAALARGHVLLFLHADTLLAPGALPAIHEALCDPGVVGGAFVRRYDSPSRILAATCLLAELRNRFLGWHLGDQAMFARSDVFARCGRFAEVDQFEDLDFSRKLARCGRIVTLSPAVTSSSRRFSKLGPVRRTVLDILLTCRYIIKGLPPRQGNGAGHSSAGNGHSGYA